MLSTTFDVRFYETDALKHVSNTAIVGWFETARMPIFKWFTPELDLDNWPLILANYNVDFLLQIYLGEAVEIKTGVNKIGNSSFRVYQEVWQSDQLKAKGETTLVHFDYKRQKASPIPDEVRDKLKAIFVD
ncbi:thioesterase family protein [Glaciecola sp. KUL10]|uniref:acyl-CoA thioesterase n=1 Tax=Glaciecola sp. (strain KUL10) TaxID=2161813 RepID=UPI000D784791|nr:thioesterase family protein [Glaciecola sp. KUL10]GBL03605.1 thioesterase superfamily protein [Glaciecola sp. KUL10]